jgi:antitoxin (DNA-binding transcriptional repressor) of toxin-antitoxin stability system
MKAVSTHEAKTHLSRLIADVERGEEVVIYRGSVAAARLVPVNKRGEQRRRPRVGTRTSEPVRCAPDAFAPLGPDELSDWGLG